MIQSIVRRAAVLAALTLFAAAPSPAADDAAERVQRMAGFARTLETPPDNKPLVLIHDNADFAEIRRRPSLYAKAIDALLSDPARSKSEKMSAAMAMQNLPPLEYLKFLERLAALRAADKITEAVFAFGAFPPYQESTFLPDNYRDARVKAFIKKARGLVKEKNSLANLSDLESGVAARNVKKLREGEQLKGAPRKLPAKARP